MAVKNAQKHSGLKAAAILLGAALVILSVFMLWIPWAKTARVLAPLGKGKAAEALSVLEATNKDRSFQRFAELYADLCRKAGKNTQALLLYSAASGRAGAGEKQMALFTEHPEAAFAGMEVRFGQMNVANLEGAEPVRWTVVEEDGSGLWLLSDWALAARCLSESADAPWTETELAGWLREKLLPRVFTEEQRQWLRSPEEDFTLPAYAQMLRWIEAGQASWKTYATYSIALSPDTTDLYEYDLPGAGQSVEEKWPARSGCACSWWLRSDAESGLAACVRVRRNEELRIFAQDPRWYADKERYDWVVSAGEQVEASRVLGIRPCAHVTFREGAEHPTLQTCRAAEPVEAPALFDCASVDKGDTVTFGRYDWDGNPENGAEPILWQVLETGEDGILLISRDLLDSKPYSPNALNRSENWASSYLCTWLNDTFVRMAFDESEKEHLIRQRTEHRNSQGQTYFRESRVSLLSEAEVKKYMPTKKRRQAFPTARAKETENNRTRFLSMRWWLRYDDMPSRLNPAVVDEQGRFAENDEQYWASDGLITYACAGVRPVILVDPGVLRAS